MSTTTSHSNGIVIFTGNRDVVRFPVEDVPGGRVYVILEGDRVIGIFSDIPAAMERMAELEVER